MRHIGRLGFGVVALLVLAGCGGETSAPGAVAPRFSLTISDASLLVERGRSSATTVLVTRQPGATGPLTLSVDDVPAGLTVSVTPRRLEGAQVSSIVSVLAASDAQPTSFTLGIKAVGDDGSVVTLPFPVQVMPPTIGLRVNGTLASIPRESSAQISLIISRASNAASDVTFSVESAPPGVTVALSTGTAAANVGSISATITVSAGAAIGAGVVRVRAALTGGNTTTIDIPMSVTGPSGPGDFGVSVSELIPIAAGQTAQGTVTVARTGSFLGAVTVAVSGSNYFSGSATVDGSSTTALLTLGASFSTPPGEYVVTLSVSGTSVGVRQISTRLAVTPGIKLTATPVTMRAGSVRASTLSIQRSAAYTGSVNLSISNLPKYFTVEFNPGNPLDGNFSSLLINAAFGTPPGQYLLTVSADGPDGAHGTVPVTVTVIP